jgi:hypothetical protein
MKTVESHQPATGNDQQIIDALISEESAQMRALARAGVSAEAVTLRGEELGMTPSFIKGCRLSGSRAAMRECVNCDARFLSAGIHNRLCNRCRRS